MNEDYCVATDGKYTAAGTTPEKARALLKEVKKIKEHCGIPIEKVSAMATENGTIIKVKIPKITDSIYIINGEILEKSKNRKTKYHITTKVGKYTLKFSPKHCEFIKALVNDDPKIEKINNNFLLVRLVDKTFIARFSPPKTIEVFPVNPKNFEITNGMVLYRDGKRSITTPDPAQLEEYLENIEKFPKADVKFNDGKYYIEKAGARISAYNVENLLKAHEIYMKFKSIFTVPGNRQEKTPAELLLVFNTVYFGTEVDGVKIRFELPENAEKISVYYASDDGTVEKEIRSIEDVVAAAAIMGAESVKVLPNRTEYVIGGKTLTVMACPQFF